MMHIQADEHRWLGHVQGDVPQRAATKGKRKEPSPPPGAKAPLCFPPGDAQGDLAENFDDVTHVWEGECAEKPAQSATKNYTEPKNARRPVRKSPGRQIWANCHAINQLIIPPEQYSVLFAFSPPWILLWKKLWKILLPL